MAKLTLTKSQRLWKRYLKAISMGYGLKAAELHRDYIEAKIAETTVSAAILDLAEDLRGAPDGDAVANKISA